MDDRDYWAIAERDLDIQNPVTDRKMRLLEDYCGLLDGLSVLDIGCGKAWLMRQWAERWDIRGTGLDIASEPDSCDVAGGAAGCTLIATWQGEGVLNPGSATEFAVPTGAFAVQDTANSAPRALATPPPSMINTPTPRPDTVPASAELLFMTSTATCLRIKSAISAGSWSFRLSA